MKSFKLIKFWIFDLDNTLYSGKTKVFEQVDKKMSKYISDKLNVSVEEARKIQKNYFYQYNTTLNGMIKNSTVINLQYEIDQDDEILREGPIYVQDSPDGTFKILVKWDGEKLVPIKNVYKR